MYVLNISIFGVFLSAINVFFAHKICGLKYVVFFNNLLIPLSLSFVIAFCIAYIPSLAMKEGWERLGLTMSMGMISYILLYWFLTMTSEEKEFVKGLLSSKIHGILK